MTKAAAVMRRASYLSAATLGLRRMGRLAACPLPAAEGREDRCEAREILVLRGALLVVDHQQALRPRAGLLGHDPDRLADGVRGDVLAVLVPVAGLLGEDAGRGSARSRLRVRRLARAARTDHQLAMGTAGRLGRPWPRHVALDEEETVGAVSLRRLPCRGSIRLNHPCPFRSEP